VRIGVRRREKVERGDLRRITDHGERFTSRTKRLVPESGVAQFHFFEPAFIFLQGKLSF
jgi:hypothetical protein